MSDFSIRMTVPDHRAITGIDYDDIDRQLDALIPGLSNQYHQIDLMVHLCGHRKYWRLYGPLIYTIDYMLPRLDTIPDRIKNKFRVDPADPTKYIEIEAARKALDDLKSVVTDVDRNISLGNISTELQDLFTDPCGCCSARPEKFEMWMLFVRKFKDTTTGAWIGDGGRIARLWVDLLNSAPDYICLPSAVIQDVNCEPVVNKIDMCDHAAEIGDYAMIDFYTEPRRNSALLRAIRGGRRVNALSRVRGRVCAPDDFGGAPTQAAGRSKGDTTAPNDGGVEIMTPPGGTNGKICGTNSRCTAGSAFCNEDPETGTCTVAGG